MTVRIEMVQTGAMILRRKPAVAAKLEEEICRRLRDAEWEVRLESLTQVPPPLSPAR